MGGLGAASERKTKLRGSGQNAQPDIYKICPVPTISQVPTPTRNSRSWASPQPRFSSAHLVLTSLLRLRLWPPFTGQTQSRLPTSLTPISSFAPPAPGFRLAPGPGPGPAPSSRLRPPASTAAQARSQACSPRHSLPQLRPAFRPLGSYQLVPPVRRRSRAANRRLPQCGPNGARGLGPPAAGPAGPDA